MSMKIDFKLLAQVTQFLAIADPRCGSEMHRRIVHGESCPSCHHDLADYFDLVSTEWPA